MPRAKKTFDREEMYKKIMPSASRQEKDEILDALGEDTEEEIEEINNSRSIGHTKIQDEKVFFKDKDIKWVGASGNSEMLFNVSERLVIDRLDMALKKMQCCHCDKCKKDIIALALNELKPHYIVATSENIEDKIKIEERAGLEVTSAILRAILKVRKTPRH